MKKARLLLLLCCCATLQAGAQTGAIKCTTERNADNTIGIYAENFTPADYSVMLIFSVLSGYSSNLAPGTLVRVSHGRSQIARLTLEKTPPFLITPTATGISRGRPSGRDRRQMHCTCCRCRKERMCRPSG
jgi:hypothetical protein